MTTAATLAALSAQLQRPAASTVAPYYKWCVRPTPHGGQRARAHAALPLPSATALPLGRSWLAGQPQSLCRAHAVAVLYARKQGQVSHLLLCLSKTASGRQSSILKNAVADVGGVHAACLAWRCGCELHILPSKINASPQKVLRRSHASCITVHEPAGVGRTQRTCAQAARCSATCAQAIHPSVHGSCGRVSETTA